MRKVGAVMISAALVLTACTSERRPRSDASGGRAGAPIVHAASLERFDACPELLDHLKAEGRKRVGPYGLPGAGGVSHQMFGMTAESAGGDASRSAAAPADSAKGSSFSGTNVQERDVDEPDIVKTNGRHIFTVRSEPTDTQRQRLASIAIDDGRPRLAGGVALPQASGYELLLAGDRILALAQEGFAVADMARDVLMPTTAEQNTLVAVVDVSDPQDMKVTHRLELEGTYASARMVDGIVRIVVNSAANLPFEAPTEPTTGAQKKALEQNKQLIDEAKVDEWLPGFKLKDDSGKVVADGPLASCDSTFSPKTFSGFGTTSVVTIDPNDPDPRRSAAVLGGAGTVYASTANLYVATQRWPEVQPMEIGDDPVSAPQPIPAPAKTSLHRFDISGATRAVYAASGEVRGTVLNQWSLSEHEGHLRVATTEDRFGATDAPSSSSFVTTLTANTPRLTQVGQVGGLGKSERIYGVRFMGDLGYVVTFRQVDPLYVIDLATPTRPRVLGVLKIPGYSAYLHPVGDGLLLGVGQDATEEGRSLGTQVALFDVGDAADPKQLDKIVIKNSHTPVEHDHHAFTWWEPSSLAIVPIDGFDPRGGSSSSSAHGFRVARGRITEAGRASHARHVTEQFGGQVPVQRSLVIDDALFTLSAAGLMGSDLASFDERGWVGFPPHGR